MDQGTSQFSPSTVAGLEFYRLHVLQDTRIVSTLNSSFECYGAQSLKQRTTGRAVRLEILRSKMVD
ncbi:hypothetical protein HYQ45_012836 [Verticillium longisporum]|uniref:Uncharacterized protein n=1 Tax=Verticillium longisporum TaxID=100787 RepID=A0A8I2ZBG3_VERLO|nr:hypothetical protein HYQ45_012836 [Verticillium longisporum]